MICVCSFSCRCSVFAMCDPIGTLMPEGAVTDPTGPNTVVGCENPNWLNGVDNRGEGVSSREVVQLELGKD